MAEDRSYMFPTSKKEVDALGWDYIDVILFSGDAFVDHPSFGTAVIARWLQKFGYRVAVVPQPNWRDDLRDFRKLGAPRLYFGVNSGAMDSMVNHYTAGKRLRHDDAYTPDGHFGRRPDYAVTVYTKILKRLFPDVPVVIGGIEASLRRLTHYDYWQDRLFPSVLVDSGADWLVYGMGERPMLELTRGIEAGRTVRQLQQIPQLAFFRTGRPKEREGVLVLHSFEECLASKKSFAENFHQIETHANMMHPDTIVEACGDGFVQVNPPYPPATEEEMDSFWDLPYTKLPHPRYKGSRIPAYDMIKFSINTHRGCFGGCNFCTIAAHQGKFIQSRSEASVLKEAAGLRRLPDFAGNISDLGAPTANMYGMKGRDAGLCDICRRKSCLFPQPCRNLDRSHDRLLGLYRRVDALPGIRHSYIGSGIRYDLFLVETLSQDARARPYLGPSESGSRAYGRQGAAISGQAVLPPVRETAHRIRQDRPGCGPPQRHRALFHFLASGLHDARHGEAGPASGPPRAVHGAGAGFHPDADDDFVGHVLHGPGPEKPQTGVRGARSGAEKDAEILFLPPEVGKTRKKRRAILAPTKKTC